MHVSKRVSRKPLAFAKNTRSSGDPCLGPQVEEELWEEEFIERCVLELLEEEEQWEWFIPSRDLPAQTVAELQDQISLLVLDGDPRTDALVDLVVSPPGQQAAAILKVCSNNHYLLCRLTAI